MPILDSVGERLARGIDRRHFLRRAAETGFLAATGWATLGQGQAGATGSCPNPNQPCYCLPPGIGYCDRWTECQGWRCKPPCRYYYHPYPDACWCTAQCSNDSGTRRGWWKCCDCDCGSYLCGCRKFVATCTGPPGAC